MKKKLLLGLILSVGCVFAIPIIFSDTRPNSGDPLIIALQRWYSRLGGQPDSNDTEEGLLEKIMPIVVVANAGGGSQTPWTGAEDAAGFPLNNLGKVTSSSALAALWWLGDGGSHYVGLAMPTNTIGTNYYFGLPNNAFTGIWKSSISGSDTNVFMVPTPATLGTDYLSDVSTNTLQNKTISTTSSGGNNTLKFTDYKDILFPSRVDGTGATILTNDYTSGLWGLTTHAGTGGTNANYAIYKLGTVPLDLDTGVTMVLKNLAVRVSGTDTGSASFSVGYYSPSSSAAYSPTDFTACTGFVTATTGTLTSPVAGDIFYLSDITLTGWASGLTAGRPLIISIARDGSDANNDSLTIVGGTILYGRTK